MHRKMHALRAELVKSFKISVLKRRTNGRIVWLPGVFALILRFFRREKSCLTKKRAFLTGTDKNRMRITATERDGL